MFHCQIHLVGVLYVFLCVFMCVHVHNSVHLSVGVCIHHKCFTIKSPQDVDYIIIYAWQMYCFTIIYVDKTSSFSYRFRGSLSMHILGHECSVCVNGVVVMSGQAVFHLIVQFSN